MATMNATLRVPKAISPTMRAEYYSTLLPLVGKLPKYEEQLLPSLAYIQKRWRLGCGMLRRSGWESLCTKKFGYARNCPPCSVIASMRLQPCLLRVCPFCHARHVAQQYQKLRKQLKAAGGGTVLSYRQYSGQEFESPDLLYFDSAGGLEGTFRADVLPRHLTRKQQFCDTYMPRAKGGIYWYSLAPLIFSEDADNGASGRWMALHSCVSIMPDDWKPPERSNNWRCIKNPNDYQLAWLVGRAFQYRAYWLRSDPMYMAEFLNVVRNVRFMSTFGVCRR